MRIPSGAWTTPGRCLYLPPTNLLRSFLCLAPHACNYHRFLCRCAPPFAALGLHWGPCQPLRGSPVAGPSVPLCTFFALPDFSSEYWHRLVLGFLSGGFSHDGKRPGRLHSLAVACPGPHSPHYLAMPAPFRLPPSPLFVLSLPSLSLWSHTCR